MDVARRGGYEFEPTSADGRNFRITKKVVPLENQPNDTSYPGEIVAGRFLLANDFKLR